MIVFLIQRRNGNAVNKSKKKKLCESFVYALFAPEEVDATRRNSITSFGNFLVFTFIHIYFLNKAFQLCSYHVLMYSNLDYVQ